MLGSLPSVFMVLPAEFALTPCSHQLSAAVKSELGTLGYRPRGSEDGCGIYEQNLPRCLRWEEGNVAIERRDATVIVRGALLIVWKIQRSLRADLAGGKAGLP